MDIEAAKCRKYRMYNAMCGKAKEIIREIGLENYIKEKYYCKILTRIEEKYNDARLEVETKKYERRNIQKKNPTKELLKTKRVQVRISEIGEIECIDIYYPVVDSEIKMISKKDYTIQEINFTKYLIEKSKFIAKNKYILILVKNIKQVERKYIINEVQIKIIGIGVLQEISNTLKRIEIVENKIMPELEQYIQSHLDKNKIQEPIEFEDFIEYLRNK